MKFLSVMTLALALGVSMVSMDAQAGKRLGAGKSSGKQSQTASEKAAAPAAPAGPAAANSPTAAKAPAAAAPAAPAAAPKRSWMGPLAGLAAGLGLAALASHFGFGEQLASMMMFGLLAVGVMLVVGFFLRKRALAKQAQQGGMSGMAYAGASASGEGAARGYELLKPAAIAQNGAVIDSTATAYTAVPNAPGASTNGLGGSAVASGSMIGSALIAPIAAPNAAAVAASGTDAASVAPSFPPGFDAEGFARHAKVNFIRMQAANDAGNLDDIREFTTPEMFAELKMDLSERPPSTTRSEVTHINAQVIEVVEEDKQFVASVRFTGNMYETGSTSPEVFDEIWNLVKPRAGAGGWVLAGIQQMQ